MTEMSPLGSVNASFAERDSYSDAEFARLRLKAGRPIFGVEMKIVDDHGESLPWDGEAYGSLKVRGPWIASQYFRQEPGDAHAEPGWFETGDVATIDTDGYMAITDRTKDVIKSGGEWISSIELENLATSHPKVAEAAVIGREHPKWSERPLLIVVREADAPGLDADTVLAWFRGKVADWWIPDAVEFVDEIPHGATGKINKLALREQFADYRFAG